MELAFGLSALAIARSAQGIVRRVALRPIVRAALVFVVRDLLLLLPLPVLDRLVPLIDAAGWITLLGWPQRYHRSLRWLRITHVLYGLTALAAIAIIVVPGAPRAIGFMLQVVAMGALLASIYVADPLVFRAAEEIQEIRGPIASVIALAVVLRAFALVRPTPLLAAVAIAYVPILIVALQALSWTVRSLRGSVRAERQYEREIFRFLERMGSILGRERDEVTLFQVATAALVTAAGADAGAGVRVNGETGEVVAIEGVFPPPVPVPSVMTGKLNALAEFTRAIAVGPATPIWGEVLTTGRGVLISRAAEDPRTRAAAADRVLHLQSFAALPLTIRDTLVGILSIARRDRRDPFSTADYENAKTMARIVAIMIDSHRAVERLLHARRLEQEVSIASEIQRRLQAPTSMSFGGFETAAMCLPARGVGGDYYDVIALADGRVAVLICDVSGKGIPAALVMVMVRTIAHLAFDATSDAAEVLAMINRGVAQSVEVGQFATVGLAIFDSVAGDLEYANGGHHPLLIRDGETIREVDADGLPIGIDATSTYTGRRVPLPDGAVAIFYTDGLTEAFNEQGEPFGEERTHAAIATLSNGTCRPHDVVMNLMAEVETFVGGAPQHDDITLVVCCRTPEPTSDAAG